MCVVCVCVGVRVWPVFACSHVLRWCGLFALCVCVVVVVGGGSGGGGVGGVGVGVVAVVDDDVVVVIVCVSLLFVSLCACCVLLLHIYNHSSNYNNNNNNSDECLVVCRRAIGAVNELRNSYRALRVPAGNSTHGIQPWRLPASRQLASVDCIGYRV